MYKLVNKKDGVYGIFDTLNNTITYVTFNDLIKAYSYIEIDGFDRVLTGYKAKMALLGKNIVIFEKTDIVETARDKVKAMKPQPYKVFNFSGIANMTAMFAYCGATELDLSNFDTSKVTNMSLMFMYCNATKLDLSNFDTSKVTDMTNMFSRCKITELDLSSFNTSEVTDMGCMFAGCKVNELNLSNFDTSKVIAMNNMFWGCKATKIDLSSFDISRVTNMSEMFYNCNATKIKQDSSDTSNDTSMYGIILPKDAYAKQKIKSKLRNRQNA